MFLKIVENLAGIELAESLELMRGAGPRLVY